MQTVWWQMQIWISWLSLKRTRVIDKNDKKDGTNEQNGNDRYKKILLDIQDILEDDDMVQLIMSQYEKGETMEMYDQNRSKRIDLLLQLAGNISYEDYIQAIKKTPRHGSMVMLKRDIDEIHINNSYSVRICKFVKFK